MRIFASANRMILFVLALLGLTAASSVVVVPESQQVVIERMGKPVRVINRFRPDGPSGAGVVLKLPFVEQAVWLDRGLKGHSASGAKIRTADDQLLLVDADVTFRIIDPVRLVNQLGSQDKLGEKLDAILPNLLGERLAQLPAEAVALPGSGGAARATLADLDAQTRAFGVQVVDLRIGRVLPDENGMKLTFQRMQERHQRDADAITEASAREARQMMADADAEAARILEASAGKDPEFYGFFRALRSYDLMLADPNRKNAATIVIPPGSAYLKHFNGQ